MERILFMGIVGLICLILFLGIVGLICLVAMALMDTPLDRKIKKYGEDKR